MNNIEMVDLENFVWTELHEEFRAWEWLSHSAASGTIVLRFEFPKRMAPISDGSVLVEDKDGMFHLIHNDWIHSWFKPIKKVLQ